MEANPSREVDGCSSRFSEMSGKCELGQLGMVLSFGSAFRPNSCKAALKMLKQENWALQTEAQIHTIIMFNHLKSIQPITYPPTSKLNFN